MALAANLVLALALVPRLGMAGSVLATALARCVAVGGLVLCHRAALPARPLSAAAALASAAAAALARRLRGTGAAGDDPKLAPLGVLAGLYRASVLPGTLRVGGFQVLTFLALKLAGSTTQAIGVSLCTLLLQTALSVCMGVQMATVMLTTRHLYRYRFGRALRVMRLAALPLVLFAAVVCVASLLLRGTLGTLFSSDEDVVSSVGELEWYVAPMLLLKASSGLHGQFLAVTGRGSIGTRILLVIPTCLGLPASYAAAALNGGSAVTLLQVHILAWLLTALCFAFFYARATKSAHEAAAQSSRGLPTVGTRAPASAALAAPLLQQGSPAPPI